MAAFLVFSVAVVPSLGGTQGRGTPTRPLPQSSDELAWRAPFNRPEHYPLTERPDPALYLPHGDWMGRLILTTPEELRADGDVAGGSAGAAADWVWLHLEQAPPAQRQLIGRRLRLSWQELPEIRNLSGTVTTDVTFQEAARKAMAEGNVLPTRLNGRRSVGPLESLAGARPHDDVTVRLERVLVGIGRAGEPQLWIGRSPVQTSGRWMGLVHILAPQGEGRFTVRHFDRSSGRFDGPIEVVRIPSQPPDRFGRPLFDSRGLADLSYGDEGVYVYGSPDAEGVFTVQAIEPRRLMRLEADRNLRGLPAGLHQIASGQWLHTPAQRGKLERVALWPDTQGAAAPWAVGDRALLIHAFGGIGGVEGEPTPAFTVTGHFSFGEARVITDPFSGEPRFELISHQIYAHNPNGIVAGSQDWSAYQGNLQRGWLGTRPFSDVLVRGDGSLLDELAIQAELLMARYRTGDGSGVAAVTPATSCVQDSSQALFIAIDQLRGRESLGKEGEMRGQLAALGQDLDRLLTPFGMVRGDWRRNAEAARSVRSIAGTHGVRTIAVEQSAVFEQSQRIRDALLSWRSMLPRRAHDDMAMVFLRHGHPLWILRTNQLPGVNPRLEPLAPTLLLGQVPVVSTLVRRLADGMLQPPLAQGFGLTAALLGIYALVMVPVGFGNGLLVRSSKETEGSGTFSVGGLAQVLRRALGLLLMPALLEEVLFRLALIPHPLEASGSLDTLAWGALSVGLFVAYHPVAGRLWYPQGKALFHDPRFQLACALLGLVCVLAYVGSGSLWSPVLIHWLVVVVWLEALGGRSALGIEHNRPGSRISGSGWARRTVR